MTQLIIAVIRVYLLTLARFSPRLAGRQSYRLFSMPRVRRRVPEAVADVLQRAERFDLDAGDDWQVVAYRWPVPEGAPQNSDRRRVMLVHGWESRAARLAVWVDPLLAAGYEVVAFDAPAHGDSPGKRTDPGVMMDVILRLSERVGPIDALVGHSLGGLASVLAVAGAHFLDRQPLPVERMVILAGAESGVDAMSMFCDALGLGQDFLPLVLAGAAASAGRPVADFDVHRLLAETPIPTLWMHDPDDDVVPFAACQRVVRTCPHVTLEVQEGLGHHLIARDPEVVRRGVEFLTSPSPSPVPVTANQSAKV